MEQIKRTKVKDLLKCEPGVEVLAKGWVRTKSGNKNVAFIALNDGSTINNIQIVVDKNAVEESLLQKITTGACIGVAGKDSVKDIYRRMHKRERQSRGIRGQRSGR